MSCSGCHYYVVNKDQCGWLGDIPPQPGGIRCRFTPLAGVRAPRGHVIALSSRLVFREDLGAENGVFHESIGGGPYD